MCKQVYLIFAQDAATKIFSCGVVSAGTKMFLQKVACFETLVCVT